MPGGGTSPTRRFSFYDMTEEQLVKLSRLASLKWPGARVELEIWDGKTEVAICLEKPETGDDDVITCFTGEFSYEAVKGFILAHVCPSQKVANEV